jgi:hypothetical protein
MEEIYKAPTKEFLELINEFNEVTEYKGHIKIQSISK